MEAYGENYRRRVTMDLRILADAQDYYSDLGYADTAVSWVIPWESYSVTMPRAAQPYGTLGGYLVASAENSFLDLLRKGENPGRAQAFSPCFRDELFDELHSPYFLKVELFEGRLPPTAETALSVLADARGFFERYVSVDVVQEGELSWDLVEARSGIELGSYGVREIPGYSWVYGTGVALPRLQQVI